MSGIVGIFHHDGRPVDREVLQKLVNAIRFRGPDAQQTWIEGNIGFGHTMLRTTWEAEHEHQPLTLDGRAWLVADARVDYREELIAKLVEKPETSPNRTPDAELILRAYQQWGAQCVEHLRGDFAFAIWDARERKLFCARDHFGVKPFYYAELGETFVFSNDLRCLRRYPGISQELNEQALIDYLAFGHNRDPRTTSFASIQKLPAAHVLSVGEKSHATASRFWALQEGAIRYRKAQEYVDHFRELLTRSVQDRARCDAVSVFMSGGLDSTAVAALAKADVPGRPPTKLKAFTVVEETLGADPERTYSKIAADYLGIPIQYLELANYDFFPEGDGRQFQFSEPDENLFASARAESLERVSRFSRVGVEAAGGDVVLLPSHASQAASPQLFGQMLASFLSVSWAHRRLARVGLRTLFRGEGQSAFSRPLPEWIPEDLVRCYGLEPRWKKLLDPDEGGTPRSRARGLLSDVSWSCRFEADCGGPGEHHVEMRYPFFDVALVDFTFALPLLPWFVEKHLLRRAMKGSLPDTIRLRPKTRLRHDPLLGRKRRIEPEIRAFCPSPRLAQLLHWQPDAREKLDWDFFGVWPLLRLMSLDRWLRNLSDFASSPVPQDAPR